MPQFHMTQRRRFDIVCVGREYDLGWGQRSMRPCAAFVALFCAASEHPLLRRPRPAAMRNATGLVLVTVPALASSTGRLRLFERPGAEADWRLVRSAEPVMVGRKGVAWSRAFRQLASKGEPLKVEGDDRSPAGIYSLGRPFGFAASSLANYLRIDSNSVCVEDRRRQPTTSSHRVGLPASPAVRKVCERRCFIAADWSSITRRTRLTELGLASSSTSGGDPEAVPPDASQCRRTALPRCRRSQTDMLPSKYPSGIGTWPTWRLLATDGGGSALNNWGVERPSCRPNVSECAFSKTRPIPYYLR